MKKFKHITRPFVEEATSVLEDYGGKARIIAGGTDLLGEMKDCILPDSDYPEVLVDIKRIAGLDYVRERWERRQLGPAHRRPHPAGRPGLPTSWCRGQYPALAEAAHRTASPHIREMGTVAGNICQNNRCWYYWVQDNLFDCLRKGGKACYALTGDCPLSLHLRSRPRRADRLLPRPAPTASTSPPYLGKHPRGRHQPAAAEILLQAEPPAGGDRPGLPPLLRGRTAPADEFDEAVSIREVERFVGDQILERTDELLQGARGKSTGKRVAIVGSGPAGLSAAHYLRSAGHEVTSSRRCPKPEVCSPTASRRTVSPATSCASRSRASSRRASVLLGSERRQGQVRSPADRRSMPSSWPPAPGRRPTSGS